MTTARVGPGATWGDVDHETQAFGLAVPGGQDPNIGVAGLTLGGGVGWLSRKYGLTCDNLRSVDVVTADGELVRASESTNPDLFWALRGGGGGVGVVTSFEFQLHEIEPEIFAGSLVYPLEQTAAVARHYRSFLADAPREERLLFGSVVLPGATVFVSPRSDAETDPAPDETAYAHRDDAHHRLIETRWDEPARDDEHVGWTRAFHDAMRPYATGDVAMNILTRDENDRRIGAAYGDNYDRLVAVKDEWDPENRFGGSHHLDPSG